MASEKEMLSVGGEGEENVLEVDNNVSVDNVVDGMVNDNRVMDTTNSKDVGPIERKGDRHKIIECKVCFKTMQSDKIRRHMKLHGDVSLHQLTKNRVPKQEWKCTVCPEQFTFEHLLNQQ